MAGALPSRAQPETGAATATATTTASTATTTSTSTTASTTRSTTTTTSTTASTAAGPGGALPPAPVTAFDPDGGPRYGAYAGEIPDLDRLGAAPGLFGAAARVLRLKRWLYAGVFGPRLFAGFAVVDAGYAGQVFGYAFDRAAGGEPVEVAWTAPLALGCRVEGGLLAARATGRAARQSLAFRRDGLGLRADVALGALAGTFRVERFDVPLSVLTAPLGGAPLATVKTAGVPVWGELRLAGRPVPLDGSFAVLDWTRAFFPHRTRWNWAAASGRDARGAPVGFNLARGVHDDPLGGHSENALWIDGRPGALPPVRFAPGRGSCERWCVASEDGSVDLELRPAGRRSADLDWGLVASRFRQPFGTWHGRLRDREGRACEVDGLPGVAEDHDARW